MQRRSGRGEGGEVPGAAAAGVPATAAYGTVRTGPGCHSIMAVTVPLLFVAALLVGFLSSSQVRAVAEAATPTLAMLSATHSTCSQHLQLRTPAPSSIPFREVLNPPPPRPPSLHSGTGNRDSGATREPSRPSAASTRRPR